jgi:hypothetical protein
MRLMYIDLMAKNNAHCLYHLGILYHFQNAKLYLHSSSNLVIAYLHYRNQLNSLSRVSYISSFNLYMKACKELLLRKPIVFTGLHLRQIILLLPLIIFNKNTTIHLHGQAFALKKKRLKYLIWKIISYFSKLEVSNPAWKGPSFISKIANINQLVDIKYIESKNNKVVFYSAIGKSLNEIGNLRKRFNENQLELHILDKAVSYQDLNITLKSSGYIYFESTDDYYFYSPSGRISDAINYGLKLVLRKEDQISISVAKCYHAKYILI